MQFFYVDDGQGQNTYVVVDFYGQEVSGIGLTWDGAMRLACRLNAELFYD